MCIVSSSRVHTLMKGLSPAYLRLGGTSADYLVFSNETDEGLQKSGVSPGVNALNSWYISFIFFTLRKTEKCIAHKDAEFWKIFFVLYEFLWQYYLYFQATDVDNLVKLVRSINFKLLFDLNIQLRYGAQWDPTNTANFLGYLNKMKYHDVFNFELGNGKSCLM